jgi:hypothetical protein
MNNFVKVMFIVYAVLFIATVYFVYVGIFGYG